MKKRTINYIRKNKARKIFQHPLQADLKTFLSATFELCRNRVVKHHIKDTLQQLNTPSYGLTA